MRSFCLGSGSAGNCFYVESSSDNGVLVDFGFSFKRVREILEEREIDISLLKGVFITHEHSDHCAGLEIFLKNIKEIQVYLTKGTYDGLSVSVREKFESRFEFVREHDVLNVAGLRVLVLAKPHDSNEACSFVFEENGKKVGIFTDLGFVGSEIKSVLKSCDVVYLEANYCHKIIDSKKGEFFYGYVSRLSNGKGHLSLSECCSVLEEIYKDGMKVILSHISRNTNSYEQVCNAVSEVFCELEKEIDFLISFQDEPTAWVE